MAGALTPRTVTFTRISPRDRRVRVITEGEILFETSRDVLAKASVDLESSCELSLLEEQIAKHESDVARQRAVLLLEHRERTRLELQERLQGEGLSAETVTPVLDRLAEVKILSDERFADCYVRSKRASGWGRPRIARELALKGVEDELSVHFLDEYLPSDGEISRARDTLGSASLDTHKERERALGRLVRKGYAPSDAIAAVREPLERGY